MQGPFSGLHPLSPPRPKLGRGGPRRALRLEAANAFYLHRKLLVLRHDVSVCVSYSSRALADLVLDRDLLASCDRDVVVEVRHAVREWRSKRSDGHGPRPVRVEGQGGASGPGRAEGGGGGKGGRGQRAAAGSGAGEKGSVGRGG